MIHGGQAHLLPFSPDEVALPLVPRPCPAGVVGQAGPPGGVVSACFERLLLASRDRPPGLGDALAGVRDLLSTVLRLDPISSVMSGVCLGSGPDPCRCSCVGSRM